ncbi:alpha/beta fold hydrolase [Pseudomonas sp. Q1]|uniref:alpha/beta fold hydrolase n=1 Tax=Pseudomonas sp. Q1 TaxID=2202823 RepID=UPI001374B64E|nr:alpha/beta hydrolase [Pseudomonas sp. Q1]NCE83788.1 alpha/beta hydrolase [Pseudomonas sp. Q1]
MRKNLVTITTILIAVKTSSTLADAANYGPRLEGFSYPYEMKHYKFESQGQRLEMAYMDVMPTHDANGKTVALLHGKNFCGVTWEKTIASLADAGYRVITPDQVGFCASSKPEGYQFSLGQLAANTDSLLASLGIENVILGGHSMGGMLAARYSIQYAEKVEQLFLVNPIGLEDWQAEGVPYATVDQLYQGELQENTQSIKAYQQRFFYGGEWKDDYDRWVTMQVGLRAGPGGQQYAYNQAQTSEMLFSQPILYELGRISARTFLLIGGRDRTALGAGRAAPEVAARLGNYPLLAKSAAKQITGSKLIEFPELGHSPQLQEPEKFHKVLLKALSSPS